MYIIRKQGRVMSPLLFRLLDKMLVGQEFFFEKSKRQLLQYHKLRIPSKKFVCRTVAGDKMVCRRVL